MSDILEHKCGLVLAYTLHDAYAMLQHLQHRGREAAGIAAIGDGRIDVLKWLGKVDCFDREDLHRLFPRKDYHTFLGHVRYATRGNKSSEELLQAAHPHTIGGTLVNNGDHILIFDCDMAMVHNGQVDTAQLERIIDASLLQTTCDTEGFLHYYKEVGERQILKTITGSYTVAIADKKQRDVIVMRDGTGIRVGMLGIKGGKYCVASEDVAIRKNGGRPIGDLTPGALYYFTPHGQFSKEQLLEKPLSSAHCMFEYLYLASPESVINGVSVQAVRSLLGKQMAQEFSPEDVDFVTYVPRAPEAAAMSYADEIGKPFVNIFYKPNAQRSFMGSTQEERNRSISSNLHLLPSAAQLIQGKKGIIVEDSVVRGTVVQRVKELLFDVAQVESAIMFSYTPQIGIIGADGVKRGCLYGVDMPPSDDFIARIDDRNATAEEIDQRAGMPVKYLSKQGLDTVFAQVGLPATTMCMFCIGGDKPF